MFKYVNTLSIDNNTFTKWDKPFSNNSIVTATKTIDSVHDELGKEAKKAKPSDWEDKVIENTYLHAISKKLRITEALNIYGKCIVIDANSSDEEGKIPYVIPNNNTHCYIKDCFPGSCVPGLNNLLDQSTASLKSFFEQTQSASYLKNPLDGHGGLGQQLLKNKKDNKLQYTAYFNYDLLIYRYIIEQITNKDIDTGSKKLNTIYVKIINNSLDNYTPKEIQLINTVNINFLWCYLMIFCSESVKSDEYLNTKSDSQQAYYNMLGRFSQIRFDGFMINGDGYISNPVFYYRGTNAYNVLSEQSAMFIDKMCEIVYKQGKADYPNEYVQMAGGMQYITSQSMAATCISKILGNIKSVVCRNADNKDPIKNACMNELNMLMNNKKESPSGWSILKFSGDSSHIVYGEILERARAEYDGLNFQITYLLSERPLAGRLLSAGKSIIMSSTNIFMENFSGKGSENKNERRAGLYINFDKSISYINIIEGIYQKIINILINNEKYSDSYKLIKDLFQSKIPNNTSFSEKVDFLQPLLGNGIERTPNASNIGDVKLNQLYNLIKRDNIDMVLRIYEIEELANELDNDIISLRTESNEDTGSIINKFKQLAEILIGRRLFTIRFSSKMAWNSLINELFNRETRESSANISIIRQFDNINKLISKTSMFYSTALKMKKQSGELKSIVDFVNFQHSRIHKLYENYLLQDETFNAIFLKIAKTYSNEGKYNRFEEERISDWLNSKKGENEKIPNGVMLIIQELLGFVDNCLFMYNALQSNKVIKGGGVINGGENVQHISDSQLQELKNDVIEEFSNTMKSIPVYLNISSNSFDFTDIHEYYNDLHNDFIELNANIPRFNEELILPSLENEIYNVIVDKLLKLSGVIENVNTEIVNTINFYVDSWNIYWKDKRKGNFVFNYGIINKLLYDFILSNTQNNIINVIENNKKFYLSTVLDRTDILSLQKKKFVSEINKLYPFLFIDANVDPMDDITNDFMDDESANSEHMDVSRGGNPSAKKNRHRMTITKDSARKKRLDSRINETKKRRSDLIEQRRNPPPLHLILYNHLIDKLQKVEREYYGLFTDLNNIIKYNNEMILYNQNVQQNDILNNIYSMIQYSKKYNLFYSKYQLLFQQYNQGIGRTSQRFIVLDRIRQLATTILGKQHGGKKTKKIQNSNISKNKRKTRRK